MKKYIVLVLLLLLIFSLTSCAVKYESPINNVSLPPMENPKIARFSLSVSTEYFPSITGIKSFTKSLIKLS